MPQLEVRESPREQASNETIGWTFDFTDRLGIQTVASATATLIQLDDGTDVSTSMISGSPDVSSPNVTVTVHALTPRKRFRLSVAATFSGGMVQDADLELQCPH